MNASEILGIPIEVGNRYQLFEKCDRLVGKGGVICTPNPIILSLSVENAALRRSLLSADLCIPDGKGLLPLLRRADRDAEVLPGIELGEWLITRHKGLSLGLVGARKGIAERAFAHLSTLSEDLHPAFLFDGYGTPLSTLLDTLQKTKPDLVFVCLGAPKQEILMSSLRAFSPKTLFLGLGGSLDVYAGEVKRAPRPLRTMRLEWLYRMIREPRRFRDLPVLLRFPYLCRKYREENNKFTKNGVKSREN